MLSSKRRKTWTLLLTARNGGKTVQEVPAQMLEIALQAMY